MPPRKRNIEDFDPMKSDSADSDFDDKAAHARPSKVSRASKSARSRPKKRQRRGYGGDASDDMEDDESDISEISEVESVSSAKSDTPEVETDEKTGRPKRKTKKPTVYAESDDDSIDFMNEIDEQTTPKKSTKKADGGVRQRKRLMITLKATPIQPSAQTARRNTRSGSMTAKRPSTSGSIGTRRNTRSHFDDAEPMVALTNSGNHAEVTRPGTRSPENIAPRSIRGGKGLKKPPSMIEEADDESSAKTKTEAEETNELSLQQQLEAAADGDYAEADGDEEEEQSAQPQAQTNGDDEDGDIDMQASAIIPESDDDDDVVIKPRGRRKPSAPELTTDVVDEGGEDAPTPTTRSTRQTHQARGAQKVRKGIEDTSDFEPVPDEVADDDLSASEASDVSPKKSQDHDDSGSNGRSTRRSGRTRASSRRAQTASGRESDEAGELAEELEELRGSRKRRRPTRNAEFSQPDTRPTTRRNKAVVDYRILRPELNLQVEEDYDAPAAATPSRRAKGGGGGWSRPLFSTYGPFGGGGPGGVGAVGGVDSDSSDDDMAPKARQPGAGVGGIVGMTPTATAPPGFGAFPAAQPQGASGDALQASLGKVKDKQALADADPLGIDPNVTFDAVGGLQGHIDQLKEMVALPLLYPEVFQRFKVTPPRGVLFHGPPGTGKTLMARALASSVSSGGRKVTFYMRKGADALSKWVGEAERQLRLLFEEARKNQPSIIFFDEIDGLAPVRSAKQDQIHSSIVSTLLALMDGMDGRGQVIVVGATNRPDSVDPALRRPGRFDREFYFPLPGLDARRKILDIHTKNWEPPLPGVIKDELAELTKGYGGADLRALCTEAALNAVQRRYPQIYSSSEKLLIDPATINVAAKDFMISVKKIVPSSERSASSGASALPKSVEPLLKEELQKMEKLIADILPQKNKLTALEEAKYADAEGEGSMRTERMQQEFERCRVFRPRLLLQGPPGMGQQYLAAALLNHFEGLHVQSFDLPTLMSDSTRSPESSVVQFFTEVKRHKPSVIYIPNVDVWYRTVGEAVISTFQSLLRSLSPTDPVLLLGVLESHPDDVDSQMVKSLFGYSKRNQFNIEKPSKEGRRLYFTPIAEYLDTSPDQFPNPADRKPRVLEKLAVAPPPPPEEPKPLTKEQKKAQKKKDRQTINSLKIRIQPVMDQIKLRYKLFRNGVVDDKAIRYLYDENDPAIVTSDIQKATFRPYDKDKDKKGEEGLRELATDKFYYNMNSVLMEERLVNGYYKRPKDFLSDVKKLTKDARVFGDTNRLNKASELQSNVEVDMGNIELEMPWFPVECEAVYHREKERERESHEKANQQRQANGEAATPFISAMPPEQADAAQPHPPPAPMLGLPQINGQDGTPATPQRSTSTNGISDLSNLQGTGHHSNGTSAPSAQGDVHMTNSDVSPMTGNGTTDSSFGPSAQTRPLHFHTGGPSDLQQRQSYPHSLSQKSAITPLAEGSNPAMYHNSASTTSSDKRNTGSTDLQNGTHSTYGRPETEVTHSGMGPPQVSRNGSADMSMLLGSEPSNSQLPGTQQQINSGPATTGLHCSPLSAEINYSQATISSSSQSQPSQAQGPAFPRDILNATPSQPAQPKLVCDKRKTQVFVEHLIDVTSACSVEQLEQIYSALMSEIWHSRGIWHRPQVVDDVRCVLEEILEDMAACQSFGPTSQETVMPSQYARQYGVYDNEMARHSSGEQAR